jgi:hypothetical protein
MWQGSEAAGVGEVPGLPLDLLRSLIRSPGPEQTEAQVPPSSPFAQPQAATMATEKPLSTNSLLRLWQRLDQLGDHPLLYRPEEVPFLATLVKESLDLPSDQERTH